MVENIRGSFQFVEIDKFFGGVGIFDPPRSPDHARAKFLQKGRVRAVRGDRGNRFNANVAQGCSETLFCSCGGLALSQGRCRKDVAEGGSCAARRESLSRLVWRDSRRQPHINQGMAGFGNDIDGRSTVDAGDGQGGVSKQGVTINGYGPTFIQDSRQDRQEIIDGIVSEFWP